LAFLLALTVLTGIVWWRVLHRADGQQAVASAPKTSAPALCNKGKPIALPAPKSVTVYVWNANGTNGLAGKIDGQLKSRGFSSAGFNTYNPAQIAGVGEIHFGTAGKSGATLLSYYLPGAKLVTVTRPDARVDVVLGTGFKALAAPAAVNKSVANAKKPC
jgi:hypothetical protein